ncbi:hypothetical protein FH972_002162 [Carpinus fangiana]|uniref:Uncharacterized protein n=1 Tax=Carpinus fangiana TaxID=176857 RepID=A0A5N6QEJ1_9ROSI|nr:hypothetical protein FH972_002162 [Carpinus fangiana]
MACSLQRESRQVAKGGKRERGSRREMAAQREREAGGLCRAVGDWKVERGGQQA